MNRNNKTKGWDLENVLSMTPARKAACVMRYGYGDVEEAYNISWVNLSMNKSNIPTTYIPVTFSTSNVGIVIEWVAMANCWKHSN